MKKRSVAVLGATGLVGEEVIKILQERNFPTKELFLFASEQSAGKTMTFKDTELDVVSDYDMFRKKVDVVFSCLDAPLAKEIVPQFKDNAVVIDNSNAFRMDDEVPLVVPEINPEKIKEHKGIIANPNCSTIQMLVPLYPLHKVAKIKCIFVATYQSVSGAGRVAVDELLYELEFLCMKHEVEKSKDSIFYHPIADNVIPQIGAFNDDGFTSEEMKMMNETRKILDDKSIRVTATCVRIPILVGHSEAISVEFENSISPDAVKEILESAPGVSLFRKVNTYPTPLHAVGMDKVYVGRIRRDTVFENGIAMWVVADNMRKGAALNAVQIAELL